jgi:hypothetical protein
VPDQLATEIAGCVGAVIPTCAVPPTDPAFLLLTCDPGGAVPPSVLAIKISTTSTQSCDFDYSGIGDTPPVTGLTSQEQSDCDDLIVAACSP